MILWIDILDQYRSAKMSVIKQLAGNFHRYQGLKLGGNIGTAWRNVANCNKSQVLSLASLQLSRTMTSASTITMPEEEDTIFEEINGKGVITLNRPKALNALNLNMVRKIYSKLRTWEQSNLKFVIIKGKGKYSHYKRFPLKKKSKKPDITQVWIF